MTQSSLELAALLAARDLGEREAAWARFVERYSPLLLHTARAVSRERDRAMDAYLHLLERLREDDCRRLRRYAEQSGAQFTTWLVVVARRLCLDHLRQRYGRLRGDDVADQERRAGRRRLADLVAEDLEDGRAVPDPAPLPDEDLARRDLLTALEASRAELTPHQRLLIALRFEDGRSAREIGQLLRYPTPFHVYRAVNAALVELRKALRRRGVEGDRLLHP